MGAHSNLSPSKAVRWLACPGSIREEANYPDSPGGPAAIDGTHTHTLLEHCIGAGLADPTNMVGVKMKDDDGEFVVDRERAARVLVAIRYIRERQELLDDAMVIPERRVDPAHYLGRSDMSGTADVQILSPDVLEIVDYKDGINAVAAEDNPQLELYALGALAALKLPVNGDYPFRMVRMTIIQPKLALKNTEPITYVEVSVQHLLGKIGKFAAAGHAVDQPDAPLVAGDAQCKYCKHKGCSARATQAMAASGVSFEALDVAKQAAGKDTGSLTNDQIRELIEAAPLLRQLLEAAEAEAMNRFKSGNAISGLKVVNGRGSRAWALPEDQMAQKLIRMGIPKASVFETKLLTVAKVEKVVWTKRDGTNHQLTERQLKTLDTEYVIKSNGKPTIVSESDPRKAVTMDAAPLFSAVSEVSKPVVESLPAWML